MAELKIEVFTSPTCPHCPAAVVATKNLLSENPDLAEKIKFVELSTRDSEGSKKARAYGIRSVPTIVVTNSKGEKGAYVGAPTKNEYLRMVGEMLKN